MTLAELLATLRETHKNPDLKIELKWDGGRQWTAVIPGYIVIDSTTKSITSSMAMGETVRDVLLKVVAQSKGRVFQIQNQKDAKPFPVPADLTLGDISF